QILWVNMTTAIFLGMMLAFEPKEPGIMQRPPQDPKMPIMTRDVIIRTLYVGILLVSGVFGLFKYSLRQGIPVEEARTVATTTLVMGELFYLFNCRSLYRSLFSIGLFSNLWVWVGCGLMILAQMLFVQVPFMNRMFHSAPLQLLEWEEILFVCLLVSAVVSVEKYVRRQKKVEKRGT
ncbi:MAG: cation transporting ATPase C-terminal domain-containing protein, partial [Candidatus Omnitrophica bacterium]|nr:cation transporting ATPase C-terminal domain-containing protein [Candidatus Omnitrophota bacterium]